MGASINNNTLVKIGFPKTLTGFIRNNFEGCSALEKTFEIPEGITEIPEGCFRKCDSMETVIIPDTVTKIGTDAFRQCSNLKSIELGENILQVGEYAFSESGLKTIAIKCIDAEMGRSIFNKCYSLEKAILPEGLKEIASSMFWYCYRLIDVNIPRTVETIQIESFGLCESLRTITIPTSVKKIEYYAFRSCGLLTDFRYEGTVNQWSQINLEYGWNGVKSTYSNNRAAFTVVHCSDGDVSVV